MKIAETLYKNLNRNMDITVFERVISAIVRLFHPLWYNNSDCRIQSASVIGGSAKAEEVSRFNSRYWSSTPNNNNNNAYNVNMSNGDVNNNNNTNNNYWVWSCRPGEWQYSVSAFREAVGYDQL